MVSAGVPRRGGRHLFRAGLKNTCARESVIRHARWGPRRSGGDRAGRWQYRTDRDICFKFYFWSDECSAWVAGCVPGIQFVYDDIVTCCVVQDDGHQKR